MQLRMRMIESLPQPENKWGNFSKIKNKNKSGNFSKIHIQKTIDGFFSERLNYFKNWAMC